MKLNKVFLKLCAYIKGNKKKAKCKYIKISYRPNFDKEQKILDALGKYTDDIIGKNLYTNSTECGDIEIMLLVSRASDKILTKLQKKNTHKDYDVTLISGDEAIDILTIDMCKCLKTCVPKTNI